MEHLHSLGIIHRDLRAANVLLRSYSPLEVVIADFGISHELTDSNSTEVLTGDRAVGPIFWLAPEAMAGITNPASDVYMFGGLMYELLSGGKAPYFWLSSQEFIRRRRLRKIGGRNKSTEMLKLRVCLRIG